MAQLGTYSRRRIGVLLRVVGVGRANGANGASRPSPVAFVPVFLRLKSTSADDSGSSVSIGDVTKKIRKALRPELVPSKFLSKDSEVPPETRKHLRWMMQKDLLGQDMFLIGRPSPIRRNLAMQYLQLTGREMEFVALSRDTTESDLKQRREIKGGTAHYVDQSAVRAAAEGRVLVLEGIEKAERNVLPVLNNLLENREMHLEDGRLLIPAARYDKLLEEHSQKELDQWKLVRVSEDFRVIALGLPVPKYIGNPLDPPLRSRFQGRDVRHLPYSEQLEVLQTAGSSLGSDTVSQVLSFAHTLVTEESSNLGLADFPVENLPPLVAMLNSAPNLSVYDALLRLYPYKSFLPEGGCQSVEDTMKNFHIDASSAPESQSLRVERLSVSTATPGRAAVVISVDGRDNELVVPAGPHQSLSESGEFVKTEYHDRFIADLILSHSVKDFCVIGPKGCGKSVVIERLADLLGYEIEPIMLYQDMTSRDLLQQRTTLENGDTVWRYSPLVTAALKGKLAVLDGIHRIHRGTLAVLHRLVHDRELQLYDGTRLVRHDRFDEMKETTGMTDEQLTESGVLKILPGFRIAALAEPPVIGGSSKEQWLTPEILSMFLFHTMRPLSMAEEKSVLMALATSQSQPHKTLEEILSLTHELRGSEDSALNSIANSLSTRQLLRIARRLERFPGDTSYQAVQKACLARFLPSLPKEALYKSMQDFGVEMPVVVKERMDAEDGVEIVCKVEDGVLHLGGTTAPIYNPDSKTKIPETLFYDTVQNIASMEAMLQDFLLGEHLLLVGNQGVGKNKLVDRLLNLLNRPREYIQLHRDTTVQSLTLQPTVKDGVIVYEDSPLVKAVKSGYVLVVDEADKAPTHVTCILKTLVESGEMILSDGRRIVKDLSRHSGLQAGEMIKTHPDFRMIVLANRPGFPFLGNDFFGALGDLFSCHAIDNPSVASEMSMLRQYGPNVSEETLRRLVRAFSELRGRADEGLIQYPYSTREVVNVVKHLETFPDEGLGAVVRNVFDFDSYDKEARESVEEVLHKHGIPIYTSPYNVSLAKEFDLPARRSLGHWQVRPRAEPHRHFPLTTSSKEVTLKNQKSVQVHNETLDRVEARGVGFSEMQSYWQLPFHDHANVGDVCVARDAHGRQLYDTIHVATSNPVWLYTMKASSDDLTRVSINHFFDASRKHNAVPMLKITPLGGDFADVVAMHEEVTNTLALVQPETGAVVVVETEDLLDSAVKSIRKVAGTPKRMPFYRMVTDFAKDNKLLFYTPDSNVVEMLDLSKGAPFMMHRTELPMPIKSLHPLNESQYLVVSGSIDGSDDQDCIFLMKKDDDDAGPMPTKMSPVGQSGKADVRAVHNVAGDGGLSQFGLKFAIGEAIDTPNTLMTTDESYATVVLGFPDLEFSRNEIYDWPKSEDVQKAESSSYPSLSAPYKAKQYLDKGKSTVFLKKSCQIVRPVGPNSIPPEFTKGNYGLASPGSISAYLEVIDLIGGKLRYVPIPEPAHASVYSSWYKQTYPDQILALSEMSNESLVSVDNSGSVRLWETGVANLQRSYDDWRRMVGVADDAQLTIERDKVGDLDTPKHGDIDPENAPHIGGNQWAGGVGGRDTAGLGGMGGPYRLDMGHDVHQVPEEIKSQVPEHIRAAAREMNRKAFEERLREIKMSAYDADLYEQYASHVRKQVQSLRTIISGLQAKSKDRQWLKNQTQGELDDTRLIEGITGEKAIYKKRAEQDPEPGAPQEKPKKLRLLVDVSGSMYRFNGHDKRLERMMESALMVMEALEGHSEKFVYDIIGHSGEEAAVPFVMGGKDGRGAGPGEPKNEKDRLEVMRTMHAHAQFCMSGDHTLAATARAISELGKAVDDHDESFVIILSDANFDRYGIRPEAFAKILNRNDQVACFAIFIGSLGDQAERLTKSLPSGKAFVCLDTKKMPEVLKTIFTSTMLQ